MSPPHQDRCLALHFCKTWAALDPTDHGQLLPFLLLPAIFFGLFHLCLLLSWHSTEGAGSSALAPFSLCTYARLGLMLSHGLKFFLLMPPPSRALLRPLPKPQTPLSNVSCSPGAWRSLWLPLARSKAPASLARLSSLIPSRFPSSLTLTAQDLFLPMIMWLWMAYQRMYHLHSPNPFWSFRQRG